MQSSNLRQRFFKELDLAAMALRKDTEAWQEELQERAAWDSTLSDDLAEENWLLNL